MMEKGECEEEEELTSRVSLRFHVFLPVWPDVREPLLDATFDVSTTLAHVTKQPTGQAKIRLCICVDLEV